MRFSTALFDESVKWPRYTGYKFTELIEMVRMALIATETASESPRI